ncbi:hypothetical protein GHT06_020956 [Daphnia sinensis]|uniref:3'-5' exonuclease domain-containing protein n=1 Tax=Daphnia sinensis TaxID=1820382 RepID=A0AAD5PS44_9CRUS|nr:hypothetical protein GHT06_020956 [Daphnia sinensis]
MASYDDFDSDTDDELLKDIVALPIQSNGNEFSIPTQTQKQGSTGIENIAEQSATDEQCSQQTVKKDFYDVVFSSDDVLSDMCRGQQCSVIQEAWIAGGMGGQQVKHLIHKLFSSSQNPHLSAVYLMYHSYDFFKNKPNSLAAFVVDQFEIWLDEFHKANGYYPTVQLQITKEAVLAVSRQKNGKIVKKVVNMYRGVHYNTNLIPIVQDLIERQEFASACRLAVALSLFGQFKKEDFVLPLIMQDKLSLAEEYLKKDHNMQIDVVSFLDSHIKQPCEMLKEISNSTIPDVNYGKLITKNMANLVTRLAKRFELDKKSHPNTTLRQKIGGLRYLVHKKYMENSIDDENWKELVELAVSDCPELQVELIEQLVCVDDEAATRYAKLYAIPEDKLPYNFTPVVKSNDGDHTRFVTTPLNDWTVPEFYALTMPFDLIHWICSWENVKHFLEIVSKASVIGIDVEWQPTFDAQLAKAAVLQIATHNQVFLLDVFSLREEKDCTAAQGQQLIRHVFGNPHILKLGYGMKEDLHVLSRSLPGLEDVSKSFVNYIDMKNLWTHIETRYPSFAPTAAPSEASFQEKHKGLSGLVNLLFGLPLDKKEQFSDWQKRPLRKSQLIYAALDAFCLLQLYDYLQKRAGALEINWWDLLKKLGTARSS